MYCKDPDEFLMRVIRSRGSNPGEVEALTGLDDGQGFLKVAFVVVDKEQDTVREKGERSKYSEVNYESKSI